MYREESERVSELKSVGGMKDLPNDTLANGAEGIKDSITNFDDAYVETVACIADVFSQCPVAGSQILRMSICRRSCTTPTLRKAER
jgi:hypothetical protein